jgi:hypothetical protein
MRIAHEIVPGTISSSRPSQRSRSGSSGVVIVVEPAARPAEGDHEPSRRAS